LNQKINALRAVAVSFAFIGILGVLYSLFTFNKASVSVDWSTETEIDVVGFNILRANSKNGQYKKINNEIIPSSDNPLTGGDYHYIDKKVAKGSIYYYELEEVTSTGLGDHFGPISVKATNQSSLILGISGGLILFSLITFYKFGYY